MQNWWLFDGRRKRCWRPSNNKQKPIFITANRKKAYYIPQ